MIGGAFLEGSRDQGVCYVLDLTKRKRAEAALQQSERRFRLLFENSTEAIIITNSDGRIIEANPSTCRLLEQEVTQLVGLLLGDLPTLEFDVQEDELATEQPPRRAKLKSEWFTPHSGTHGHSLGC